MHFSAFWIILIPLIAALCGCSMPQTGARGEDVERSAIVTAATDAAPLPYCLVPVNQRTLDVVQAHQYRLAGRFEDKRPPKVVQIGVGDVVSVTLYESGVGGLFFPADGGLRNGNFLTLPNQIVDERGEISVPFAGAIRARGRTAQQIQAAIVDALKDRALDPQAVVTVVERRNAMISVFGEVNHSTRYAASLSGERVLDAISRAGGIKSAGPETWVLLERDKRIAVTPFESLVYEPANNIYVNPQDTLYLYREPQTFLAFGATGRQGQYAFEAWRISVAEAIAKAGGLLDERAEPGWVFLYRVESAEVARKLDSRCTPVAAGVTPVVYEFNLRDPATLFLAGRFPMRNKDIIYISNTRSVQATKFMTYLRTFNATIQEPIQTAITAYTLKSAMAGTSSSVIVTTGTSY